MPPSLRALSAAFLALSLSAAQAAGGTSDPALPAADTMGDPGVAGQAPALPAEVAVAGPGFTLPAGTELVFEMGEGVTSKTAMRGDRFALRLADEVRLDGQLLIPAGTPAMGEVVHADRARAGGQAGELILAARYLEWDGRQLPLSAFRPGIGKNRTNTALGVTLAVGVVGFLVRGGDIEMPAGGLITAKLREAALLAAVPEPAAPVAAAEPAEAAPVEPVEPNPEQVTPGETEK